MRKTFKLQSAMEYLMTYGWAILIIAVVLGVLFQMGVFNSSSLTVRIPPGACKVLRTSAAVNLVGQCSGILPKYVAQFDGQSSTVDVGNAAILNPANGITVSAWVNINSYNPAGTSTPIVSNWNFGTNQGWDLRGWGTNMDFVTADGTTYYGPGITAPPAGAWAFIVGTGNQVNVCVYINSKQSTCSSGGTTISQSSLHVNIGHNFVNSGYLNGQISNVQIYNTSLDASSIATLYQEGIGGAPVDPSHLVGWWPLNGDVKDYSGNNNNGAPTAITYTAQYGK